MTATIFKYSLIAAVALAAAVAGVWYFVAPPDVAPEKTLAPQEEPGTIAGSTSYPSDFNPAQRVCAQSVADENYERCADVPEQEGTLAPTFSIKVTPGSYYVYATLKDPSDMGLQEEVRAYYTEFVTCGLRAGCPSHARLEVVVSSGQTVSGINPQDWYIIQ